MRQRRRLPSDHEDTGRWLVSYADLVTLLFAFFVVMYAVSSVNENKYRQVSEALEGAFGKPPIYVPGKGGGTVDTSLNPLVTLQFRDVAEQLNTLLAPAMKGGQVRLKQDARGLGIEINSQVLFAAGRAELAGDHVDVLRVIAEVLAGEPYDIEIAGHTDNLPISSPSFPSNWELSAMRAAAVLRVLEQAGIAGPRLKAVGRGDSLPIATNLTPEGRARNRRVELTVLSKLPEAPREVRMKAWR